MATRAHAQLSLGAAGWVGTDGVGAPRCSEQGIAGGRVPHGWRQRQQMCARQQLPRLTSGRRGLWGRRPRRAARSPTSPGQTLNATVAAPWGAHAQQLAQARQAAAPTHRSLQEHAATGCAPLHPSAAQPAQHKEPLTYKRPAPHHQHHASQKQSAALVVLWPAGTRAKEWRAPDWWS